MKRRDVAEALCRYFSDNGELLSLWTLGQVMALFCVDEVSASDLRLVSQDLIANQLPNRKRLTASLSQALLDIADNHPLLLLKESTR